MNLENNMRNIFGHAIFAAAVTEPNAYVHMSSRKYYYQNRL